MDASCLLTALGQLSLDPDKVIPQHDSDAAIAIRDSLLHPLSGSRQVATMEAQYHTCCRNLYPLLGG